MGTLHVYASLIFGPSAPVETSNKGRVESRNDGRGGGVWGPSRIGEAALVRLLSNAATRRSHLFFSKRSLGNVVDGWYDGSMSAMISHLNLFHCLN